MKKLLLSIFFSGAAFAQIQDIPGTEAIGVSRQKIVDNFNYLNTGKASATIGSVLPSSCTYNPAGPAVLYINTSGPTLNVCVATNTWAQLIGGGSGPAAWGQIVGALTDQADLLAALAQKAALVHGHAQSDITGLVAALAAKEGTANKGQPNGYAPLDSSGKVPSTNLPPSSAANWGAITGNIGDQPDLIAALSSKEPANANIQQHVASTSNPHSTTKAQVGLGNVTNDAQLKIGSNLGDLGNVPSARINLGLGGAAVLNVGGIGGTVAAGDHLHDARYPQIGHAHGAGDVTGGLFSMARLAGSGTCDSTTVLYGDQVCRTPPGSSGGEANTASNQGAAGVGVFKSKLGVDLGFYKLNPASARISIGLDGTSDHINLDVVEPQINHQNLSGSGTSTHAQIDTHLGATNNPHGTTCNQVGAPCTASTYSNPSWLTSLAWSKLSSVPSGFAPNAHAASHGTGQSDSITIDAGQVGSGTFNGARLPNPGTSSKGGVFAKAAQPHYFLTAISNTDGAVSSAQPAAGDISGLGDAAIKNTGTAAGTVAAGDHTHASLHTQNTDTGTNQASFQLDSGNAGAKFKNNAGTIEVRNAGDSDYADLKARSLTTTGTGPSSETAQADPGNAPATSGKCNTWVSTATSGYKVWCNGQATPWVPEITANKSANTSLGTSDTLYPTQNAVKSYVDAHAGGTSVNVNGSSVSNPNFNTTIPSPDTGYVAAGFKKNSSTSDVIVEVPVDTDGTMAANSDSHIPSQKAVLTKINAVLGAAGGGTVGSHTGTATFSSVNDGACATTTVAWSGLVAGTPLEVDWSNAPAGTVGNVWATTNMTNVQLCNLSGATLPTPSFSVTVSGSSAANGGGIQYVAGGTSDDTAAVTAAASAPGVRYFQPGLTYTITEIPITANGVTWIGGGSAILKHKPGDTHYLLSDNGYSNFVLDGFVLDDNGVVSSSESGQGQYAMTWFVNTSGIVFKNNRFRNTGLSQRRMSAAYFESASFEFLNNSIENTITNMGLFNDSAGSAAQVHIGNNRLDGSHQNAIQHKGGAAGAQAVIANNIVSNVTAAEDGQSGICGSNSGECGNGIDLYATGGETVVSGNSTYNTRYSGIRMNSASATVTGNIVRDAHETGIYSELGAGGSTIIGNKVYGATTGITNTNVSIGTTIPDVIAANQVRDATIAGVWAENALVTANHIWNSPECVHLGYGGIGAGNQVSGNHFSNCTVPIAVDKDLSASPENRIGLNTIQNATTGPVIPVLGALYEIAEVEKRNPVRLTYIINKPSNGNVILLQGIQGMTELNNRLCTVQNVDSLPGTFECNGINSSGYGTYMANSARWELIYSSGTSLAYSLPAVVKQDATANQRIRRIPFAFDGGGSALSGTMTRCNKASFGGSLLSVSALGDVPGTATLTAKTAAFGAGYTGEGGFSGYTALATLGLSEAAYNSSTAQAGAALADNSVVCVQITNPSTFKWIQGEITVEAN